MNNPENTRSTIVGLLVSGKPSTPDRVVDLLLECQLLTRESQNLLGVYPTLFPAYFLFDEPIPCSDTRIVLGPKESDPEFYDWNHFIPPEYFSKDSKIDQRSIVFALGILGYKLLAGESFFFTPSPKRGFWAELFKGGVYESMQKRLRVELVPIEEVVPTCPLWLKDLIYRAIAANPDNRFSELDDFFKDLSREKAV